MVVFEMEPTPAARQRAQVDGVTHQLRRGHQGVDDLLAVLARFGALHPTSAAVEVAQRVPLHGGGHGDLDPAHRFQNDGVGVGAGLPETDPAGDAKAHLVGVDRVKLAVVAGDLHVHHGEA